MADAGAPLEQATLDGLWDFNDAQGSERRFEQAQVTEADAGRRAELATQQARALTLQSRFDEAAALLDQVSATSAAAEVRLLLERGRLHNSAGRPGDAVPLFRDAAEHATAAGHTFLAIDALHMVCIADPSSIEETTTQALALVAATDDPRTRRWAVSLHNNLGWARHDEGRYDDALTAFEAAHEASRQVGTTEQEYVARWAVARCLRSLGRHEEALAIQQQLAREDPDDDYVAEELEALRTALGAP